MSDYLSDPYAIGLPTARVLEDVERPKGFVISKFPQATKERIEAARQNVPEIPDERIDRSTDPWTDRETGEPTNSCASSSTSSIPQRAALSRSRSRTGTSSACARRGTSRLPRAFTSATSGAGHDQRGVQAVAS